MPVSRPLLPARRFPRLGLVLGLLCLSPACKRTPATPTASAEAAGPGASQQAPENKYLVVVGSHPSREAAVAAREGALAGADVVATSRYKGLAPGWYALTLGAFDSEAEALRAAEDLKQRKVEATVRFAGARRGPVEPLSQEELTQVESLCKRQEGSQSPDGRVVFTLEKIDPTASRLVIRTEKGEARLEEPTFQATKGYWSPSGRKLAFVEEDLYAGDGVQGVLLVDVEPPRVLAQVAGKDFGNTDGDKPRLEQKDVCWLQSDDAVVVALDKNFVASSGHPGIDEGLKDRPGFNQDAPEPLGNFLILAGE
jgi:hypothetical protein